MPTYEYKCTECGGRIEVFQRITADPLTTCEACGGSLKRVLFPVGVVYKGSGFYTTDYARKNGGGEKPAGGDESNPEEPKPEKSEKKETVEAKSTTGDSGAKD